MRRRELILGAGAAAVWASLSCARAADRRPVVGMLWMNPPEAEARIGLVAQCHAGLAELGLIDGKTLRLEERFGDGTRKRADELATELVGLGVDLIVTAAEGGLAAARATKSIPIVTATQGDPVAEGMAASLAHPGGNLTGNAVFFPQIMAKRIELLKQCAPSVVRVGALAPQVDGFVRLTVQAMAKAAAPLAMEVQIVTAGDEPSYRRAFASAGVDGFVILDVPLYFGDFGAIASLARQHGSPTVGAPHYARAGGLIGYGVFFPALFHGAAVFVDKILKGAKPGDIPIEQATKFETIANLKTAAALGLQIPPTLLGAANEVIE